MAGLVSKSYSKHVMFPTGKQKEFINLIKNKLSLSSSKLALIAGVHIRTLTDWQREKFSISLVSLKKLCRKAKLPPPKHIQIKNSFWYAGKGACNGGLAVYRKYGRIGGDPEKRKERWHRW